MSAGAASVTRVHNWMMQHPPAGTHGWFAWTNAWTSELVLG
jgi:meiotically up-regulated gene 157 (Mug157) protein